MVRSENASFTALIPKKKRFVELKDFKLINLTGSVYKLVTKVLAERLTKIMTKLISGQQSAFMKNRQITDASIIANEVLVWKLKTGDKGLVSKLDIEKAFDQLYWAYLIDTPKMAFGNIIRLSLKE